MAAVGLIHTLNLGISVLAAMRELRRQLHRRRRRQAPHASADGHPHRNGDRDGHHHLNAHRFTDGDRHADATVPAVVFGTGGAGVLLRDSPNGQFRAG